MSWINSLKHLSQVYAIQLKNNLVRETIYPVYFYTTLFTNLIWMFAELSLFTIIYSKVPSLSGWNREQVYFFLGVFFINDAFFTLFFDRAFWHFPDLINRGNLDGLLLKPIPPLFLAFSNRINPAGITNAVFGLALMMRFASAAGFLGGLYWLLVAFWVVMGTLVSLLLRFFFIVWVFWTQRNSALSRLYYHFFSLGTKPDPIYPTAIRYGILTLFPFAWIGSVPARALLFGLKFQEYVLLTGVLIGFYLINTLLWRTGLKNYQSASS